ncbi:MAG TPA: hypothetical protein VL461_04270 [Dictyobacter sp.]|nr:hypothetical protein [Dictyobacter sp.]
MVRTILALEKDLFFSVKIRDTLKHYDIEARIMRNLPAFEQQLTIADDSKAIAVVVNISTVGVDWEAAIRAAYTQGYPVLAYGSHKDLDARAKALQAGAQKVVANSKFSKDLYGLIERLANTPVSPTPVTNDDGSDFAEDED